MNKRTFKKFIDLSIEKGKRESVIYDNGLDLINFLDDYTSLINILLKSIYGEEVSDMIIDFIFDSINGDLEKNKSNYYIYKNNEIIADCSTLDGLFEYSEEVRLDLISSNYSYEIKDPMTDEERIKLISEIFESDNETK